VALIAALLVAVPFIAMIPFGDIRLPRIDSYIPVVDTNTATFPRRSGCLCSNTAAPSPRLDIALKQPPSRRS
jgi:hypothetical protein